jgi:hypothetical protein
MNPKEIAEELIIKMINAADRKQTQRVRECFADVVFVDHSSLNGMRGALVSADEFVTSWQQLLEDAQTYTSLSNFELLPAQEGISAECHAHMVYMAPGVEPWEIFGRQIFEIFRVSGEHKITSFQFAAAAQRGNKNFLKELQARKKRSKLGQIYDKFSGKK